MDAHYDILIVGSGLYGAVCAYSVNQMGKKCLVIDKNSYVSGNLHTERINDINVQKYGPHIFHTNNKGIWNFVTCFSEFNLFVNRPLAKHKDKIYNLPINMNTFNSMFGITDPKEAKEYLEKQAEKYYIDNPKNLEELALMLFGKEIYENLIKGYTEKKWGIPCSELPTELIKKFPIKFTYDNNYFGSIYQGIPKKGYTYMIKKMLHGVDIQLGVDYLENKAEFDKMADKIVYTGGIDEYFSYSLGILEYTGLRYETEALQTDNYQGNAIVNYTDSEVPFTRIIEHKHFANAKKQGTVITKEYSCNWSKGDDRYYPIRDKKNIELYNKYVELSEKEKNVFFGGRLGKFQYYDMDKAIEEAFEDPHQFFCK